MPRMKFQLFAYICSQATFFNHLFMKYKSLFALAAASLTMLFACQKPVDLGPEQVSIDSEATHEFPIEGGEYTVQLTATVDWTLQGYDENVQSWLSVTPSSGKAAAGAQTITIKAMANDGANRQASLVFYGNIMHKAPLTITQKGPDGEGAAITIAEFIEKADTKTEYVLSGVAGDIATSDSYWGFTLKDDTGTISCPFIGATVDEFKAMNIHTGDKVNIKGKYEWYDDKGKQEHQLSDGSIVSHEPVSIDAIQTVTVADFIKAADPFTMYRLVGEVSSSVNTQYCSFDIKDDSGTIVVWTVNNAAEYASTLKKGDKVTLRGAYTLFTDKSGKTKHEVVDATIESVEPGQGGGEIGTPAGTGTAEDPYNVAGAYKFIDDNKYYGDNTNPNVSPEVYVKGVITSVKEVATSYGNATYLISDAASGAVELEVYRGYYLNGDKFTSEDQIKQGDEVVVKGQLTRFFETYEFTTGSSIYSINNEGGGEEPGVEEPTSATKVTIEEFLGKPVSETDWYELTGKVVSIVPNNAYGNLTISDETGSVYVYGLVKAWAGGKNDQSFPQIGLEVGDIVTLWAVRDEYGGSAQAGSPAIYKSHEDGAPVTYPEGTAFLTFPDDNSANNALTTNHYETEWEAKIGDVSWKIYGFNNNAWKDWSYIRCGRKNVASVATIKTATALPALSAVEVMVDNVVASNVNSVKLSVYSDAGCTSLVEEVSLSGSLSVGANTFAISDKSQSAGQYYVLSFDCAAASKNGIIQISKVTYIAAE